MERSLVLEAAGLVRTEKVGRVRVCQIVPEALSGAEEWIGRRLMLWEARLDRLDELIAGAGDDERTRT